MAKEPADLKLNKEEKLLIMQAGGTYEIPLETHETFLDWLPFITNPLNLQPGLPYSTIIMDKQKYG